MAWRNPHRQTISDLSAFPKHLLLSPALLELPHWLLVNYANKVMFEHIVLLFFCNCASLHSLPPSSRGTIKVTEHVSKIYASVTNYNALSLISPLLLLPPHRFSYVFAFWGGLQLWVLVFSGILFCFLLFFFSLVPEYQCVTSLHICSDRRLQPKRVDSGGFDSLKTMQNLFWSFTFSFRELSKWLRSRQLDGYGGREDIGKNTCTLAADLHVNRNIFS